MEGHLFGSWKARSILTFPLGLSGLYPLLDLYPIFLISGAILLPLGRLLFAFELASFALRTGSRS